MAKYTGVDDIFGSSFTKSTLTGDEKRARLSDFLGALGRIKYSFII